MIGLDGYMLIRYINICFKTTVFFTIWGLVLLLPVYVRANDEYHSYVDWNKFTIANIRDDDSASTLWIPAILAYIYAIYFCNLVYTEYKNFVQKRIEYLNNGDPDTPPQTYYTCMVERIPPGLRSAPSLNGFFEKIFPGDIYAVEVALDLNELDRVVLQRRQTRDRLEKLIAEWKSKDIRPVLLVSTEFYKDMPESITLYPLQTNWFIRCCGYHNYDAIDHYYRVLGMLNDNVLSLQNVYFQQMQKLDELEALKRDGMVVHNVFNKMSDVIGGLTNQINISSLTSDSTESSETNSNEAKKSNFESKTSNSVRKSVVKMAANSAAMVAGGVGGLAREGMKTAEIATKGALKGMMEAKRTLELLTFGEYYRISSTAFVTFRSRVAKCTSHQMLLSHQHLTLYVRSAPNPKDIIWDNVSIPQRQVRTRRMIADVTLIVGAIFWSFVVGFLATISNLEFISKEHGLQWLQDYNNTPIYAFLNNYLTLGLLLVLLAVLPLIFDVIARNYEGLKLESEIQNSIMKRYFYYQIANVYVSLGLGSLASSLHQVLNQPSSIFNILGSSLPLFSTYFANLLIVKTFTAVPIEMMRFYALAEYLSVYMCKDKRKFTRRELKTGAFANPQMLYGWIYPNLLMVIMIVHVYSIIAPLLMPFAMLFFLFAYAMYKYQLIYVYVNNYQAGGFMWYAVFSGSMVSLIFGVFTLICYMGIRETYISGPFYMLVPLPFGIMYFWYRTDNKFKEPSMNLSLESAKDLDRQVAEKKLKGFQIPHSSFKRNLFRQPSLVEGPLKPAPFQRTRTPIYIEKPQIPEPVVSYPVTNDRVADKNGFFYRLLGSKVTTQKAVIVDSITNEIGSAVEIKPQFDKVNGIYEDEEYDIEEDEEDIDLESNSSYSTPTQRSIINPTWSRVRRGSKQLFSENEYEMHNRSRASTSSEEQNLLKHTNGNYGSLKR